MVVFVYYRARSPFCQMTSWNQVEHMRPAFKLKPKFKGRSRILLDNLRRHTHALNAAEHLAPSDCFDLMRRSGTAKRRRRPPQALLIATCMDFMAFQHAGTVAPVFANGTVSSSISDGKDVRDLDAPRSCQSPYQQLRRSFPPPFRVWTKSPPMRTRQGVGRMPLSPPK